MFSDGFSEGRIRDIDEDFPPDSTPYTKYYDYLSDSDLEDEEDEEQVDEKDDTKELVGGDKPKSEPPRGPPATDSRENQPQPPLGLRATGDNKRLDPISPLGGSTLDSN